MGQTRWFDNPGAILLAKARAPSNATWISRATSSRLSPWVIRRITWVMKQVVALRLITRCGFRSRAARCSLVGPFRIIGEVSFIQGFGGAWRTWYGLALPANDPQNNTRGKSAMAGRMSRFEAEFQNILSGVKSRAHSPAPFPRCSSPKNCASPGSRVAVVGVIRDRRVSREVLAMSSFALSSPMLSGR